MDTAAPSSVDFFRRSRDIGLTLFPAEANDLGERVPAELQQLVSQKRSSQCRRMAGLTVPVPYFS